MATRRRMFTRTRTRVIAIAISAFVAVILAFVIPNTISGVYGSTGSIFSRDVQVGQHLDKLAAHVRAVFGVQTVKTYYLPLTIPEPAATIAVEMKDGATAVQYARAVAAANSLTGDRTLPQTTLTVQLYDGLSSVTHGGTPVSVTAASTAIAKWFELRGLVNGPVHLLLFGYGTITRASFTALGADRDRLTSLEQKYPEVFAHLTGPSSTLQWTLPGFSTTSGLPTTGALEQLATLASKAPVQLNWNSARPLNSALCFPADATGSTAAANAAAKIFATSASPVVNFCFGSAAPGVAPIYRFHVGTCSAIVNASAADTSYFAGLASAGIALPSGSGAGSCGVSG